MDVDGDTDFSLPESRAVRTRRGYHLYYTWPQEGVVNNSVSKLAEGVDVRGAGGYVVAPPSSHADGRYAWKNRASIIPAPSILTSPGQAGSAADILGDGVIMKGGRNDALTKIAGSLNRLGMSEDEVYDTLVKINSTRVVPSLGDTEVRRIAHSVSRYDAEDSVFIPKPRALDIRVWTAQELRDLVLPTQDEIIGPLLVRGNRLVIAGHTGEGKTTLGLQLVHAAVNGQKFLRWRGQGQVRVLVLDAEQGLRTIQRRLSEAGLEGEYPHYIRVPDGLNLDDDAEALLIEEVLALNQYDVLVLDPLYKLHKGELTDERVSVELMRRLDAWREQYNFALLLLAHCRKPSPGMPFTIHDVFGSTAILRGAEVVLGLQRVQPGESLLHFFKDRDGDLPVGDTWELNFDQSNGFSSPLAPTEEPSERTSVMSFLTGR